MDQVDYINGQTRVYGIVGDPIAQVRSPEMVTHELQRRGLNAILVPLHVARADFDRVVPHLMQLLNLDGLVMTIPFKSQALNLASTLGPQARAVGALNALARRNDGTWAGEMFDGMGCVQAFARRGLALREKSVLLIGLGGAGGAIAAAVASEQPLRMHIWDLEPQRCQQSAQVIGRLSPHTHVHVGPPDLAGVEVLMNASPVGMLDDARLPLAVDTLPPDLVVFDAIVYPQEIPLLRLARRSGCQVVTGREMMQGQIARIVDFFIQAQQGSVVPN
jgi:shikimate dehydrogenase